MDQVASSLLCRHGCRRSDRLLHTHPCSIDSLKSPLAECSGLQLCLYLCGNACEIRFLILAIIRSCLLCGRRWSGKALCDGFLLTSIIHLTNLCFHTKKAQTTINSLHLWSWAQNPPPPLVQPDPVSAIKSVLLDYFEKYAEMPFNVFTLPLLVCSRSPQNKGPFWLYMCR